MSTWSSFWDKRIKQNKIYKQNIKYQNAQKLQIQTNQKQWNEQEKEHISKRMKK